MSNQATETVDAIIENHGSIVGITPMTPAAREWIEENCAAEPWQFIGATLNVEPRCAEAIVEAMQEAGLTVE